jgi:DNA-binding NtrC family response regulator
MKGKVLIIEDEVGWQEYLQKTLVEAGFFVEITSDLDTALQRTENERFHFITIDLRLKEAPIHDPEKFEGWEVLSKIKKLQLHNTTPTMVVTGYESDYAKLKGAKKLEGIYYMSKSEFDEEKFISIIEKAIESKDIRFKDDHRNT